MASRIAGALLYTSMSLSFTALPRCMIKIKHNFLHVVFSSIRVYTMGLDRQNYLRDCRTRRLAIGRKSCAEEPGQGATRVGILQNNHRQRYRMVCMPKRASMLVLFE